MKKDRFKKYGRGRETNLDVLSPAIWQVTNEVIGFTVRWRAVSIQKTILHPSEPIPIPPRLMVRKDNQSHPHGKGIK